MSEHFLIVQPNRTRIHSLRDRQTDREREREHLEIEDFDDRQN